MSARCRHITMWHPASPTKDSYHLANFGTADRWTQWQCYKGWRESHAYPSKRPSRLSCSSVQVCFGPKRLRTAGGEKSNTHRDVDESDYMLHAMVPKDQIRHPKNSKEQQHARHRGGERHGEVLEEGVDAETGHEDDEDATRDKYPCSQQRQTGFPEGLCSRVSPDRQRDRWEKGDRHQFHREQRVSSNRQQATCVDQGHIGEARHATQSKGKVYHSFSLVSKYC